MSPQFYLYQSGFKLWLSKKLIQFNQQIVKWIDTLHASSHADHVKVREWIAKQK